MDMLAKAFFDYQSFVNLPHKAVQLHKTPPSQAGADPSAGWAPKSYHHAGRNQAAPQARANRNHVEHRPGGPRHGRPSKLEFRNWGTGMANCTWRRQCHTKMPGWHLSTEISNTSMRTMKTRNLPN
uniref:Uncharacterized protein n=1 Tax=Ditylenchus dipsaci TaxID=166011 RepID=A0A915DRY5_9BILA